MDRNECKALVEEIRELITEDKKEEALDVLDGTNWRKVHNVNMLVTVSQLYEELDRIEDSKELLLIAHERSPIGRVILYHLALICVRRKELNEAEKYYEEFVEIAPHDSMKFIIKYNLAKARGADTYTLIAILEDMKEFDFQEDWAFELAYLYHKSGQAEKCIDLCDEIVLWFGDGPYVEKALELKLMYHPLDKTQEAIYRSLKNSRDGITEIKANEMLESGEIISHDIEIPSIEIDSDRFNTINLQAEIKKNIEEIMKATEEGAVDEKMENIKELVEEIPYLQLPDEQDKEVQKKQDAASKEIDETLKSKFKDLLNEDLDGQISLQLPEEKPEAEEQVEGQMTIDDVMKEWQKTKKAAETALEDADKKKLESVRESALSEANQILDRLIEVIPRLEAGESIQEITRAANIASIPKEKNTFTVPKFSETGLEEGVGLEIPVVDAKQERVMGKVESEDTNEPKETKEWNPPKLTAEEIASSTILRDEGTEREDVNYDQASKIFEDMNNMLQKQIDEIYEQEEEKARAAAAKEEVEVQSPEADEQEVESVEHHHGPTFLEAKPIIDLQNPSDDDLEPLADMDVPTGATIRLPKINVEEVAKAIASKIDEPVDDNEEDDIFNNQSTDNKEEEPVDKDMVGESEQNSEDELPTVELDHKTVQEAIAENLPTKSIISQMEDEEGLKLSHEERVQFSYFVPVSGMEEKICQVLAGAKVHLTEQGSHKGHIIVEGISGSGKTMMATSIVKVLQSQIGKPGDNVGKIDGDKLNEKDVQSLYEKIRGGCLIVEKCGRISNETAVTLNLLMENDQDNTLIIFEGLKEEVDKILSIYPELKKKFTERMTIPIFTIDELVIFAKAYVKDWDCVIDEMGILALYNRISTIQGQGNVVSLADVRDILDEAIRKADKGGLFSRIGNKKYDDDGNMILHEKDFQE